MIVAEPILIGERESVAKHGSSTKSKDSSQEIHLVTAPRHRNSGVMRFLFPVAVRTLFWKENPPVLLVMTFAQGLTPAQKQKVLRVAMNSLPHEFKCINVTSSTKRRKGSLEGTNVAVVQFNIMGNLDKIHIKKTYDDVTGLAEPTRDDILRLIQGGTADRDEKAKTMSVILGKYRPPTTFDGSNVICPDSVGNVHNIIILILGTLAPGVADNKSFGLSRSDFYALEEWTRLWSQIQQLAEDAQKLLEQFRQMRGKSDLYRSL